MQKYILLDINYYTIYVPYVQYNYACMTSFVYLDIVTKNLISHRFAKFS